MFIYIISIYIYYLVLVCVCVCVCVCVSMGACLYVTACESQILTDCDKIGIEFSQVTGYNV